MVLDTKWKKFKYSNGNKTLCVLLALVMVLVIVFNSISIFKALAIFEDDILKTHEANYKDSTYFMLKLDFDIDRIFMAVGIGIAQKEYSEAEDKYVEKALKAYKAEEEKNRLSSDEVEKHIEMLHNDYSIWDEYYGEYYSGYDDRYYLSSYYNIYYGDDHNWYKTDFDYKSLTSVHVNSNNIAFGHSDAKAEEMLRDWFNQHKYREYVSVDTEEASYGSLISDLKNIKYYAESDIVFTNVTESVEQFIKEVKGGKGNYFYCEDGKLFLSGIFKENEDKLWSSYRYQDSSNVYISIDTEFGETDRYSLAKEEYENIVSYNVAGGLIVTFFAFIAFIAFAVMSVRLAGHTEDGIKTAKIDGFPTDIHFLLSALLISAMGYGTAYISYELIMNAYRCVYPSFVYFNDTYFISGDLIRLAIAALVCAIYLLILEFAASVARNIKAERPIIKKTAIYQILALVFKLLKLIAVALYKLFKIIFKNGGKGIFTVLKFIIVNIIGGFFKLIWKGIRGILHLCKLIALKPKRLEKKLISATVLYTLFNFVSVGIIIMLFFRFQWYGGPSILFAFVGVIALPALDIYTVYRATKYLKALDDIIDTSAKREPLPYDSATLPPSLKTLAESLEATNAELQEAVMRAVKDERTKAELITNVSHDLKTPLTSVINYIDLLQKCDIEDETAKQYMAVIEEKSARLKRLIEDLIEASKVSTGNVTLNKTKLNLSELASQAIVEETSDIEKNNLQIIFDEAPNKHIVFADGTKIYRVFENLLSNARKYSAPYTRIYASVYSDDNFGYFEIKNISKEALNISAEELTERFVRGDKSRSQEGNGLGLSIARELCKLNDGDLIITIDGDLFKATVKLPKEEI